MSEILFSHNSNLHPQSESPQAPVIDTGACDVSLSPSPESVSTPVCHVCNIGLRLREVARRLGKKTAVIMAQGRQPWQTLTFSELESRSDGYARGFRSVGIGRGTRTLLMVRPGRDLFSLTFALFKVGAVPVLIDPGMGVARLLHCIASAKPEAMVGIGLAQLMRVVRPSFFKSVKTFVTVGHRWCWGGYSADKLLRIDEKPFEVEQTRPDELAAVLFTTGSTGPAKGVLYEHGMFEAQCELIGKTYGIDENDIDLPTFPLFGLFSIALGMTAVIPEMDPTRPAKVNPQNIIRAVNEGGCTFSFGSPALWGRVSKYCVEQNMKLPSLKNILMAGAPVSPVVHERLLKHILSDGAETHTPYGATESLPATSMKGSDVLAETAELTKIGRGTCVGRPVHGVSVEVIRLTDDVIESWDDSLIVADGKIGEITVKGPAVTKAYDNQPEATRHAKIQDGETVRHRIGDLGYKDEQGRLWFCGRKNHRVETTNGILYTVCCEAIFNQHPQVFRSALVGVGLRPAQTPVIVVEPVSIPKTAQESEKLVRELLELGWKCSLTKTIVNVLLYPSFPVDIRHNAKIGREQLALWAAQALSAK